MICRPNEHIVILGGGIAGLSTGLELARQNRNVTVIEKNERVGGLARTIVMGDFRFDIGGHRFHSSKPGTIHWVQDLLGSDLLRVPRISHIYLQGKFVDYPIRFPNALGIFPPTQAARIIGSYGRARLRTYMQNGQPERSFEDWIVNRFGQAMFEVFFRPYTEKVWGITTKELSADWAAQRISLPSLSEAVKQALIPGIEPPPTAISHFWYPRLGFGMIPDRMKIEIEKLGGRVLTGTSISTLANDRAGWQVTVQDGGAHFQLDADRVVSSLPIDMLLKALPESSGAHRIEDEFKLTYRDMVILLLALRIPRVSQDSWTYFPQPELLCGRTHEPRNWSQQMVPDGYTSLAAEVFTSRGEDAWNLTDDTLIDRSVSEFEHIGFLPGNSLHDGWVLRVPYAYPVYYIGYADKMRRVNDFLQTVFPTLHLVGRTGSFRYMNSDGVIEDSMALTQYLVGKSRGYVDVSQGYKVD